MVSLGKLCTHRSVSFCTQLPNLHQEKVQRVQKTVHTNTAGATAHGPPFRRSRHLTATGTMGGALARRLTLPG